MRQFVTLAGSAAFLWTIGAPLGAQQSSSSGTDPRSAVVARSCDGQVITGIDIVREEPRLIGRSAPGWSRPVLRTLLRHTLTKESAVEPFLMVEEGGECSDFRLAESARVLRAQPYFADATVTQVSDPAGGVRVQVETVDEIPLIIGLGIRDGSISKLEYGSSNVRGEGIHAAVSWRDGFAYRDGFGLRLRQYHLLGQPIRVGGHFERAPHGSDVAADMSRPFYTRFQHVGWHVGARDASGYTAFIRPDAPRISLRSERTRGDAGAVFRLGGTSALLFAGPFITHQRFRPAAEGVVVADTGLATDPDTVLDDRYESRESTRFAGVLGARWLSHVEVLGFDALAGPQDVARGVQTTVALGRSLDDGGGTVAAGYLFAGAGGARRFVGLSVLSEGQQQDGRWGDAVVSGRLALYDKPSLKRTLIVSAEYSGAWRAHDLYQLALGHEQGGLRGYADSRAVGARRAVLRAEHRWVIGAESGWLALGAAAFGDAGKIWAGDVPFGTTTGVRASAGVSILAAVPRQSRRLLRVDFAMPVVDDPHAKFDIRVSTSRSPRDFWREPGDIARLRAVLPPAGVFGWP